MRYVLPTEYRNRKNIKESLRTSHLPTALECLHRRLAELGLTLDPVTEDLHPHPSKLNNREQATQPTHEIRPEEAYHKARNAASMWTDNEIEGVMEIESDVFHEQIEALHIQDPAKAKKYHQRHQARIDGYERVLSKEDTKFNPTPHKYAITLKRAAELLAQDYKEAGKTQKQLGRVNISVGKFLSFLDMPDVNLTDIAIRHVKQYIRHSARKDIPLNTFSAELGILDKVFQIAQEEGLINDYANNPFLGHRPLEGFKKAETKGIFEPDITELLAIEALNASRYDILVTVAVSYYTGMRCSELFECVLVNEDDTLCFDIRAAKTTASIRKVPLHDHLRAWLTSNELLPELGKSFEWSATSTDAFNKRFNRFNKTHLIKKHKPESKGPLTHHSFRHGMATRLHRLGLTELEVASVIGHSRDTVAQTTSGRVYIAEEEVKRVYKFVNMVRALDLPDIPKATLPIRL